MAAKDPVAKWAKHAATVQSKRDGLPKRFEVKVLFYTSNAPSVVAVFGDYESAAREARQYLNADARGIWINGQPIDRVEALCGALISLPTGPRRCTERKPYSIHGEVK